jgi:hypothetical protein
MIKNLKRIAYNKLNSRQQENYNFQKISAVLADYGFVTMRLTDDWQGADFIAQHIDGETFMKVQLKGRLTFEKKYIGKDIQIAFQNNGVWYLFPHDELLEKVSIESNLKNTDSWLLRGGYSFPSLSAKLQALLAPYKIFPFDFESPISSIGEYRDQKLFTE